MVELSLGPGLLRTEGAEPALSRTGSAKRRTARGRACRHWLGLASGGAEARRHYRPFAPDGYAGELREIERAVATGIREAGRIEVARPGTGDQLAVGRETFIIQGEPERRDPDRLVWTLDVRPT